MSENKSILLYSADEEIQSALKAALTVDAHYDLRITIDSNEVSDALASDVIDAIIYDIGQGAGLAGNILVTSKTSNPDVVRLIVTRTPDAEIAVELSSKASVFQVITLPQPAALIALTVSRALEFTDVSQRHRTTSSELKLLVDEDLTRRRAADIAIREREEQLRAIIDTAVDGVIIIDRAATVRAFNPACEKLFGYQADEVIGNNVKMLMPTPYRTEHDGYMSNYHNTGERKIIGIGREVTGLRKNGSTFPMELSVGEAHRDENPIYVGIIRDITERKNAERAIERSVNELASFAYSVAHDLKAPLRAVSGFATALEEDYRDKLDGDAITYINFITDGAGRMARMIDDLLEYSRLGRDDVPFAMISPLDVIKGVEHMLVAVIEESDAKVTIEGEWEEVEAHSSTLAHVFQNLISNAIKFTKPDVRPEIRITGHKLANAMEITIADNGIGIPEDCHHKIFQIFHRLHNDTDYQGTGIGLAVVKKGVNFHKGHITLSSAPDTGTIFTITLPKVQSD